MSELRDFTDRLWNGEIDTVREAHPVLTPYRDRTAEEIDDRLLYYKGIAGVVVVDSGESLVMLDTGARNDREPLHSAVRSWRPDSRLAAAVFSHHHVDHIFGVGPFEAEQAAAPTVYGNEHVPWHFDRYERTAGWNMSINGRQFFDQFGQGGRRPAEFIRDPELQSRAYGGLRYPDITFEDRLTFTHGDLTFELHHARGETEDSTWTWVPELKLLAPGDLFIWAVPNAGNPQKVQRYVSEWAAGLREMAALGAELMVPGHGFPIFGADRVRQALSDTAELLESIESQVLALMNVGATLDRVLHEVEIPAEALEKPYLRPVYDHPQFLIRNVWRLYGGWYDGEPDHLLPAPRGHQARVWMELAGGVAAVLERAADARAAGDLALACHLVEMAAAAEPTSSEVHELRAEIYAERGAQQESSMARGIFEFTAASSRSGVRDAFSDAAP
jgi:alkyl sulfatase BDS1-like metallo-beta-lactamase superfamily hydrolase